MKIKGARVAIFLLLVLICQFSLLANTIKLEDGYYIKLNGKSGSVSEYHKMVVTPNENCWMENKNLLECYVYLPLSELGFSIVNITDGVENCFEPTASVQEVKEQLFYEPSPKKNFFRGEYISGLKPFAVSEEGLYYIAVDISSHWIVCSPIKKFNILGSAIPGGWEPAVLNELTPVFSADKQSAVFANDMLEIRHGFFKIRMTDGWKITVDSITSNDCWNKGSKVNVNYGGSVDKLVLGGANIISNYDGVYSVKLTWTAGSVPSISLNKLMDIPRVDYSYHKIGIVGDAYDEPSGIRSSWKANWGAPTNTNTPAKENLTYTWTFSDVKLYNGGHFKLRQGSDWTGLSIDFSDIASWSGNAVADFRNMDGEFVVVNGGSESYNIVFKIDAETNQMTLKVDK